MAAVRTPPASAGAVSRALRAAVEAGTLRYDPAQQAAAAALDAALGCGPAAPAARSWWAGLAGRPRPAAPSARGVYLFGGVGRGKTLLLDAAAAAAARAGRARRTHFASLLLDVHRRLHSARREADPLAAVAAELADNFAEVQPMPSNPLAAEAFRVGAPAGGPPVLLVDELEVTDVADALVVRRLFDALLARGVVPLFTSNAAPEELYAGGLNRQAFLPFVHLLRERCHVVCLDDDGDEDYRAAAGDAARALWIAGGAPADEAWRALVRSGGGGGPEVAGRRVPVSASRSVVAPTSAGRCARFAFGDLCGGKVALGAADYLAVAQAFPAVLVEGVPPLHERDQQDALRRFVTLIDVLYERRALLVVSAHAQGPEELLRGPRASAGAARGDAPAWTLGLLGGAAPGELGVAGEGGSSGRSTTMVGGVEWSATGRAGASLAHLAGANFAERAAPRAVSRLTEMRSLEYLRSWCARHGASNLEADLAGQID